MIKIGDKIPNANGFVMGASGIESIGTSRLFKGKKIIFTGVPAAFSPTCSKMHIPSYLTKREEFNKYGVDSVICLSVNDAYVMYAWSKKLEVVGRMIMLADSNAEFTNSMGFNIDLSGHGLGIRSNRFVIVSEKSKVTYLAVEKDATKYDYTNVDSLINFLKK